MNAKGGNSIRLTNHPKMERGSNWSPDSKSIVFMPNRGVGNWDIYKMDTDGQNVVRLTDDPQRMTGLHGRWGKDCIHLYSWW